MKRYFDEFTNLYEISRTLKFRLVPDKRTEAYLEAEKENDYIRSTNYPIVKEMIDDAYRRCINKIYSNVDIDFEPLYNMLNEENTDKDKIMKECEKYRKKLHSIISKSEEYKSLSGSKFLDTLLKSSNISEKEKEILNVFNKFTIYFTGFYENRANVFSVEDIPTSLYYRMVNDNFITHFSNIKSFETLEIKAPEIIEKVEENLKKMNYIREDEKLKDYFLPKNYNRFLIQKGIDLYNTILGGYAIGDTKYTGINEEINAYNQTNDKENRLRQMMRLRKQILSKNEAKISEAIESDEELYEYINNTIRVFKDTNILDSVDNLISNIESYDLEKIYISINLLNKISFRKYKDYAKVVQEMKNKLYEEILSQKKGKKLSKKEENNINKKLGITDETSVYRPKSLTLDFVQRYLRDTEIDVLEEYKHIINQDILSCRDGLEEVVDMLKNIDFSEIKHEENIEKFKKYSDSMQDLIHDYKGLNSKNEVDIDTGFYYEYERLLAMLSENTKLLNLVRNYVTKATFNSKKIKLNFNIPSLADGWSKSKENDNRSIILRRNGLYYLGIIKNIQNVKFDEITAENDCFEKMEYNLFPGPNKMLPKCMFTKEVKAYFSEGHEGDYTLNTNKFKTPFVVSKKLYDVYNVEFDGKKKFQKDYLKNNPDDVSGYRDALNTAIDGCIRFLNSYKSTLTFDYSLLKKPEEYEDISEFYTAVSKASYSVKFEKIDKNKIDSLVESGDLLLFQIYNKDFSTSRTGKENLHTMYFKSLFEDINLERPNVRLSGNAEIFFREKSIENPVIHKVGDRIINKTYIEDGVKKSIPGEIILEINRALENGSEAYISEEAKKYMEKGTIRTITHDIVKDRRYTQSQYYFHFPIKINPEAKEGSMLNSYVSKMILKNKGVNIIGIDRGERNLIYVTVIDKNGKIIEQRSLNMIGSSDYQNKLDIKEKSRNAARKSWKTIGNIKNLKEGYISQVVYEIVKLVEKYEAIIVMENLNVGFKRGRMKVEKQIYQKFENMLTNKLSYLVFKDRKFGEDGSVYRGYQLARPIEDVMSTSSNNGIIFYVPAGYTSKIDPLTGFVNVFRFGGDTTQASKKEFFEKMDSIKYDNEIDMFRFDFDFDNYEINQPIHRKQWSVCTNGYRIINSRNKLGKWVTEKVYPTEVLKTVLNECEIDYKDGQELKALVLEHKILLNEFYDMFKTSLRMRNSDDKEDSIISPVEYQPNKFYNSNEEIEGLPKDADANGAYNIARKGLLAVKNLLEEYKNTEDDEGKIQMKTAISNKEWFEYIQGNNE